MSCSLSFLFIIKLFLQSYSKKNSYNLNSLLLTVYMFYLQVENMGRVNYGPYIFDRKVSATLPLLSCSVCVDHGCIGFYCWSVTSFEIQGILSPIQIDGITLRHWKMYPLALSSLDILPKLQLITQIPYAGASKMSIHGDSEKILQESSCCSNGNSLHSNSFASSERVRRLILMQLWSL